MRLRALPRSVEDDERDAAERLMEEVHARRLKIARERWQEIALPVRRPLGFLVDAETDLVYKLYRGAVFQNESSTNLIADQVSDLAFFVTDDGPVFVQRVDGGTWSERLERRASSDRPRLAPRRH